MVTFSLYLLDLSPKNSLSLALQRKPPPVLVKHSCDEGINHVYHTTNLQQALIHPFIFLVATEMFHCTSGGLPCNQQKIEAIMESYWRLSSIMIA